jgi:hypothetical protein
MGRLGYVVQRRCGWQEDDPPFAAQLFAYLVLGAPVDRATFCAGDGGAARVRAGTARERGLSGVPPPRTSAADLPARQDCSDFAISLV